MEIVRTSTIPANTPAATAAGLIQMDWNSFDHGEKLTGSNVFWPALIGTDVANIPVQTNAHITLDTEDTKPALKSSASFGPDPNTGQDVLTTPGNFSLSGPAGLNLSFTAITGTTGAELATQLASLIDASNPNYAAVVVGNVVEYNVPQAGQMNFTPNGQGITYDLMTGSVPEPASLILLSRDPRFSGLLEVSYPPTEGYGPEMKKGSSRNRVDRNGRHTAINPVPRAEQ